MIDLDAVKARHAATIARYIPPAWGRDEAVLDRGRLLDEVERLDAEIERLRLERCATDRLRDSHYELEEIVLERRGERDEARAEVERLRKDLDAAHAYGQKQEALVQQAEDEAWAARNPRT